MVVILGAGGIGLIFHFTCGLKAASRIFPGRAHHGGISALFSAIHLNCEINNVILLVTDCLPQTAGAAAPTVGSRIHLHFRGEL